MSTTQEASGMAISEQVEQMERDELEDFAVSLYEDLEERLSEVESVARDAHETATEANERVDTLEDEPTVQWKGKENKLDDLWVDNTPVGKTLSLRGDQFDELDDRVYALEQGEVDVSDIIDGNNSENQLPIQIATDARKNDRHDFSGNKLRATYVWPQFSKRSKPDSSRMVLYGWQVKQILDENELDTNPNTVRRTMEFLAKLTSEKPKDERDPKDDDNLVTFHDEGHENTLVADKDEWDEFFTEQLEAVGEDAHLGEDAEEATTTDDATDNVDEDVDGLMAASAVTSSDDDDVTDEAGIEVTR